VLAAVHEQQEKNQEPRTTQRVLNQEPENHGQRATEDK
jgi:hypothetical protein